MQESPAIRFIPALTAALMAVFFVASTPTPPARAQEALNVDLVGHLPIGTELGDIWVANDIAYLALFGGNGASIVDVSDPANPVELTQYSTPATAGTWDVKAAGHYAYLAPQNSGVGLVILDVADPANPVLVTEYSDSRARSVHNVWVDTTTATAYLASNTTGDVEIVDISNPALPVHRASFGSAQGSIHDMVVFDGIMYASFLSGGLYLADVTDPSNPTLLGFVDYPDAFTHNAWPSKDRKYVFTTDEVNGGHVRVFDVQDLANIHEVAAYQAGPPQAIIHNVYVQGDFLHVSYYSEGYRVVDVSDPLDPVEVGFYDTFPGQSGGFNGAWGAWPFGPLTYVSDIESGLFVFDFTGGPAATLRGFVRNDALGTPLSPATVSIPAEGREAQTAPDGSYSLPTTAGLKTVFASAFGFAPESLSVRVDTAGIDLDFDLVPFPTGGIAGFVRDPGALGVGATVTLYARTGETFETTTGPDGAYSIGDIPATNPPWVEYDSLVVRPEIPFVPRTRTDVVVPAGDALAADFDLWRGRVLLIDDDGGDDLERYYRDALEATALADSVVSFEVPPGGDAVAAVGAMGAGDVVTWFSGDEASGIFSAAERTKLAEYRDGGGHLFLTGQNIAEDLDTADPAFLSDVLGVQYGGLSSEAILEGIADDPLAGGLQILTSGNGGANNQTSRDVLIPEGGAAASIEYSPGVVAGVWAHDAGSGARTVFFGFGFEAVNKSNPQSAFVAPEILMGMVLDFLRTGAVGMGPGGRRGGPAIPRAFALGQNYPNPFNPSTAIPFTVPAAGADGADVPVRLDVFDVRGRLVATLLDRAVSAGAHVVQWDGRDAQGAPAGSGIYLYRLHAGAASATRRMVLVK